MIYQQTNFIPLLIIAAIIALIIGGIILFFLIKPYVIRYDTTKLFTGGLGSGKTCEMSKLAQITIRKNRLFKWAWPNFKKLVKNKFRKIKNYIQVKRFWQGSKKTYFVIHPAPYGKKPMVYSNYPYRFRPHPLSLKYEWAIPLEPEHITLLKEIYEYSIVLIDEFPQLVSQFDWDIVLVQTNMNEWITFFRHYIGGHFFTTAQSEDEIECHIRRKLNIATWCYDFKTWPMPLIPLFYTNRMCDFMMSDNVQTMSTTYIEENTKLNFGFFPGRYLGIFPGKLYDSRCYKPRYEKVPTKVLEPRRWDKLTTREVLRIKEYISPLDTSTNLRQIAAMEEEIKKLKKNDDAKA